MCHTVPEKRGVVFRTKRRRSAVCVPHPAAAWERFFCAAFSAFAEAAELGTNKVISSHSTIAVLVTTDGSVTDIERSNYVSRL